MSSVQIIPLGGLGEVGMNCLALRGPDGIVVIDCGVTFPSEDLGADIVRPRFDYLMEHREILRGIVITHGHEDHIGALPYLLEKLEAPIWAPDHAAELITARMSEWPDGDRVQLTRTKARAPFEVGGFSFDPIRVTHSITEATALAIRCGDLTILHTGDFKLDPHPADGERTDEDGLRELGDEGVDLLLSDSTNVDSPGDGTSELEVGEELLDIVKAERGRVVVSLFASNVQRLLHLGEVARKTKRRLVLAGRSLHNHVRAASVVGKLAWPEELIVPMDRAGGLRPEQVLLLATGSQGEQAAALSRLADESFGKMRLEAGDAVVFSARVIPGNERRVHDLFGALLRRGVRVISRAHRPKVHASGHAHRGELTRMMDLVRPKRFIPVHGTLHHLFRHAELARSVGIEDVCVIENGDVAELTKDSLAKVGRVDVGRVLASERVVVPDEVLTERRQLAQRGAVTVTLIADEKNVLVVPAVIVALGVLTAREADVLDRARKAAAGSFARLVQEGATDDGIRDGVRLAVRAAIEDEVSTRTRVIVTLSRVRTSGADLESH